jgi:parallel beta-helix repeat protein
VPAGETLTLPAGTILESVNFRTLFIDGTLNATEATIDNISMNYRLGSGGTVQGGTINGGIIISGNSVFTPATPTITDNDITSGGGFAIDVSQTAAPMITDNRLNTNGTAIRLRDEAAGTFSGNTINFLGNTSGRTGIEIANAPSTTVSGNVIADDPVRDDFGIRTLSISEASTVTISNNQICSTDGDKPMVLGLGIFADTSPAVVSGNTLTCDQALGIRIGSGSVASDTTIDSRNGFTTYGVEGSVTVNTGASVTVATGISIVSNATFFISGDFNADGVTLNGAFLDFRAGAGGTIQNSTISSSNQPIRLSGNDLLDPADPEFIDNTISGTGGDAASVRGASAPTFTGNTLQARINGISFNDTTTAIVTGNTVIPLPGGSGLSAFALSGDASPTISGNTIIDDPGKNDIGFAVRTGPGSSAEIRDNDICSTGGDRPFLLNLAVFADDSGVVIEDNNFICGSADGLQLASGALSVDAEISPINGESVYSVESTITIQPTGALTIPAGITIDTDRTIHVSGGELNLDGAVVTGGFINFFSSGEGVIDDSVLSGVRIDVNDSTVTIVDSMMTDQAFTTINLGADANAMISGNIFDGNNTVVVVGARTANWTLSANTFLSNGLSVSFNTDDALFDAFPALIDTNEFLGGADENQVGLPTAIGRGGTLDAIPVPYFSRSMTVAAGSTLFLEPGVAIQSQNNTGIRIDGRLVAMGEPDRRIIFTVINPAAGNRWRQVHIVNQSGPNASIIENCIFEYGGLGGIGMLTLDNADIDVTSSVFTGSSFGGVLFQNGSGGSLTNSSIFNNQQHGIRVRDTSNPIINFNSIFGNTQNAINHEACNAPDQLIDAENNYFGDDSGPFDNSDDRAGGGLFNPTGLGDQVTNCVDYDPFLTLAPTIEGTVEIVGGSGQTGMTGTTLADPLVVEVRDLGDNPLEGIAVIFSVVFGDASIVEEQPRTTGADGRASATVLLGDIPGDIMVAASASDVNSPAAVFMPISESGALTFEIGSIAPADWQCPGDCDGRNDVTVAELTSGINIMLGGGGLDECASLDRDADGQVVIAELVRAVRMALEGCPTG